MKNENVRIIDKLILILCILQVCLFNFINISGQTIKLLCILIVFNIFCNRKISKKTILKMGMLLLVIIVCFISFRLGHDNYLDVFMSNIRSIIYAALPLIFFSNLSSKHYEYVDKTFLNGFWLINGYAILNIFISITQVFNPGFMAGKSSWISIMPEDLICGTFGYSCTPQFGMFYLFVFFYNIYYLIRKPQKKWMKKYNICILLYMLIISLLNDNKAVYFELPLFGIFYLALNKQINLRMKMSLRTLHIYFGILTIAILLIVTYFAIPSFKKLLDSSLLYAINLFFEATRSETVFWYGSAERVYAVIQAFTKYDAINFGYGTGTYIWQAGTALGFRHFGQADLGSFLCLGGIWFTISVLVFCFWCLIEITDINRDKINKILLFLIVLALFFYAQIITANTLCIIFIFIMITMGMVHRYTLLESEKKK